LKKVQLLSLAASALLLAGCATVESPTPAPTQNTESAEPRQTAEESAVLTKEQVREIVLASFEKFESDGMTETVLSDGESWKLIMDPEQPDYKAALFNLTTGERQLVFETDYFTVFVGYLTLESPGAEIEITDSGFIASAEDFNPIEFFVEDGLLVGARGVDFDWNATFEYQVDPDLRIGLLELTDELLASFEE
jgi:hypothetical protein